MCKRIGCDDATHEPHFIWGTCTPSTNQTHHISIIQQQQQQQEAKEVDESSDLVVPLLLPKSPPPPPLDDDNYYYHHHHRENTPMPSTKVIYNNTPYFDDEKQDQDCLSFSSLAIETKSIADIALPMILTGFLIYSRSIISMIFLGRLGELALAGGSLAVGFANITGYSVLSGLALGMEPICGQAFGAQKHSLLGLTLFRTILFLLVTSIPISLLWLNMDRILLICGQDHAIAAQAQSYLFYSLFDLLAQSLLHPLRIFLRTQSITLPLTITSALAIILHFPLNWFLVLKLDLGIKGVAVAGVCTNFLMLFFLFVYLMFFTTHNFQLGWVQMGCLFSWAEIKELIGLAIPSCISVCLEWWWYEIMILLCGLLPNPKATVASMGILIQTTSLIYIFPSSLSVSLSTRVGNELGAGRPKRAKRAAVTGLFFSFLLGFSAVFFTFMVRGKWAGIFTKDAEIIKLTTLVLPIIGLCELGNCPQTTGCGVLRGTAQPKVGANINLGCFYLVGMPVAIWLGFFAGYGFHGLWIGLLAAQGSCVVTMMVVLNWTDWEFQAQRAKKLTDHSYLDDEEEERQINGGKYEQSPLLV